jgi:hypothetical protein
LLIKLLNIYISVSSVQEHLEIRVRVKEMLSRTQAFLKSLFYFCNF